MSARPWRIKTGTRWITCVVGPLAVITTINIFAYHGTETYCTTSLYVLELIEDYNHTIARPLFCSELIRRSHHDTRCNPHEDDIWLHFRKKKTECTDVDVKISCHCWLSGGTTLAITLDHQVNPKGGPHWVVVRHFYFFLKKKNVFSRCTYRLWFRFMGQLALHVRFTNESFPSLANSSACPLLNLALSFISASSSP